VVVGLAHGQDFSSHKTTPSRAASVVEIIVGLIAALVAWRGLRRRGQRASNTGTPKWLDRLDRTHWVAATVVGAFMLTYSLTIAAAAEVLKAHVSTADDILAFAVFAIASMLTILAPVVVVIVAPERSDRWLTAWRSWLLGNSRVIGLIAVIVIGAALVVRGVHDLIT
jgi:hypothetical protein